MSNKALTWAWSLRSPLPDGRELPKSAKDVLVRMADYANQAWECYPSQELLADEVMVSRKTVQRAIAKLIELGLLTRVRYLYSAGSSGGRDRTVYRVGQVKEVVAIDVRGTDPWAENGDEDDLGGLGDKMSPNHKTPVQRPVENSERLGDILSPNPPEGVSVPVENERLGDNGDQVRGQMASRVKGLTPKEPNHHHLENLTTEAEPHFGAGTQPPKAAGAVVRPPMRPDAETAPPSDDDSSRKATGPGSPVTEPAAVLVELARRNPNVDAADIDVEYACRTVLARATRPVSHRAAFVAAAIARTPDAFRKAAISAGAPRPARAHDCATDGHNWKLVESRPGEVERYCPVCGEVSRGRLTDAVAAAF